MPYDGMTRHMNGNSLPTAMINGDTFVNLPNGNCLNGQAEDPTAIKNHLRPATEDEEHDLVVAGFGPASLAIAIAMQDAMEASEGKRLHGLHRVPKVAFLEKQLDFAWHSGMLLDGAKMQISFIKDMATLRNPRSKFTFLNYLHKNQRIVQFSNLNTFLPTRLEFEDYLRWCARQFKDVVSYGQEVLSVTPEERPRTTNGSDTIKRFVVRSRNVQTGVESVLRTRHVVIAIGGKPNIPSPFNTINPRTRIIHSSQYSNIVADLLPDAAANYRIGVIGGGQSAAEIFDNLHGRYPNCRTHLIIRGQALRPSDDSPFVNEVFDPDRIGKFYEEPADIRSAILSRNKSTNYSVVRIELLEKVYETLYMQRLHYETDNDWPHRILPNAVIRNISATGDGAEKLQLSIDWKNNSDAYNSARHDGFDYDLLVLATGYTHDGHLSILDPVASAAKTSGVTWATAKDYKLVINNLDVSKDAGIWLQGCNEATHGLSDTLLSALAVRGGEIVKSIFDSANQTAEKIDGPQFLQA